METKTINTSKITGHNSEELFGKLKEALVKIEHMIKETIYEDNNGINLLYSSTGDVTLFAADAYSKMLKMGICDRRRMKHYLNQFQGKASLCNINKLLRLIHRTGLSEKLVKVSMPKHEKIQTMRKRMLELRAQYELSLKAYKDEKGNFYKVK